MNYFIVDPTCIPCHECKYNKCCSDLLYARRGDKTSRALSLNLNFFWLFFYLKHYCQANGVIQKPPRSPSPCRDFRLGWNTSA
jgi:hypothetical protein